MHFENGILVSNNEVEESALQTAAYYARASQEEDWMREPEYGPLDEDRSKLAIQGFGILSQISERIGLEKSKEAMDYLVHIALVGLEASK